MGVLGRASNEEFSLPKKGEYIFTVHDIREWQGESQFKGSGKRAVWVFLLASPETPDQYVIHPNGDDEELWQFTDPELKIHSRQREWVETILGRTLEDDEEIDEDRDIIGKKFVAELTHVWNKTKTKKSAYIDDKSARPYAPKRRRPTEDEVDDREPVGAGARRPANGRRTDDEELPI